MQDNLTAPEVLAEEDDGIDHTGPAPAPASPVRTELLVTAEDAGKRLDLFIPAMIPTLTRSAVHKLIEAPAAGAGIAVNGKPSKAGYKLRANDTISVIESEVHYTSTALPENIPLKIV